MSHLAQSIQIKNTTFKNRIIKGAMSEALANREGQPNNLHLGLYEAWAKGGLGCAITGNVMVNIEAKNEPGVVAIETEHDLEKLKDKLFYRQAFSNEEDAQLYANYLKSIDEKTMSYKLVDDTQKK